MKDSGRTRDILSQIIVNIKLSNAKKSVFWDYINTLANLILIDLIISQYNLLNKIKSCAMKAGKDNNHRESKTKPGVMSIREHHAKIK